MRLTRRTQVMVSVIMIMGSILSLNGCEERTVINNYNNSLRVSGSIKAWQCYVGYPYGAEQTHLFSDITNGDSAQVTFTRLNGRAYSLHTNDSSSFDLVLDEGAYSITIESGWTLPKTFNNVYIARDTTFTLDVVLQVVDPVNMNIAFWYKTIDSLGAEWEWDQIRLLNGYLHNKLAIRGFTPPDSLLAERDVTPLWDNTIYSEWTIQIYYPEYHIQDVYDEIKDITDYLSNDSVNIDAYPAGIYICLN